MDDNSKTPKRATPFGTLLGQIVDPCQPKTEREWAAKREIERLQAALNQYNESEIMGLVDALVAQTQKEAKKQWRCKECGAVTLETALLTAPSPFDAADILTACPTCKEVNDFYEVCDEPGCTREAGCGFPAGPEFGGYRRTCFAHSQWSQALPDKKKNDGIAAEVARAIAIEREACAERVGEFARKWWSIHCASNKHMETTRKAHNDFCALQAAIRARSTAESNDAQHPTRTPG